jgi:hypothetical protein
MTDGKPWYTSITIWGLIITGLATLGSVLGYEIGDPSGFATEIVQFVGGGIALYGRIRAVKKIGKPA